MEPERKIEKLLRAFAKKRRADADKPLELHPVNRRRLQNEVTRLRSAPDKRREGNLLQLLLAVFRRRLAFTLCVMAIVLTGVVMFLPAVSASKRKAQSITGANNLKEIAMADKAARPQPAENPPAAAPAVATPPAPTPAMEEKVEIASAREQSNASDLELDARRTAGTSAPQPELARSEMEKTRLAELPAPANAGSGSIGGTAQTVAMNGFTRAKSPDNSKDSAQYQLSDRLMTQTNSVPLVLTAAQNFARADVPNLQNLFKNSTASTQAAPVLQSFQLQQNGNAISVVDRDGSVYNGSVQPETTTVQNEPVRTKAVTTQTAPGALPPAEGKPGQAGATVQQVTENYSFRVAGMNRTLKQNIVFTGNVLANNTVPQSSQTINSIGGFGGGGGGGGGGGIQVQQTAANQQQQNLLSNSRIVGTAVIANTNQIEINAVPVTQ